MENKTLKVVTTIDENGNTVKKFELPECHQYGDYVKVKESQIQEAKDELLLQLFDMLKELSKDDKFWIVKRASDFDNSILGRPAGFADDDVTVGYKIDLPQMYGR